MNDMLISNSDAHICIGCLLSKIDDLNDSFKLLLDGGKVKNAADCIKYRDRIQEVADRMIENISIN